MISFKRGKEIPSRTAKADWLIPSGLRNSSRSISPGCVGGRRVGSRRRTMAGLGGARRALVVVRDLDFVCIARLPTEAHAIAIVDPDAVVPRAIPAEPFQPVARRDQKIRQVAYAV
jgi:hypothetical protein